MSSIDALAKAIKEFEGGVVIVSHDFRTFPSLSAPRPPSSPTRYLSFKYSRETQSTPILGLISQVAEELWEVADQTIKNLTKKDISIIDYKKNLIKQSTSYLILPHYTRSISVRFSLVF